MALSKVLMAVALGALLVTVAIAADAQGTIQSARPISSSSPLFISHCTWVRVFVVLIQN
jgi:hypothetical protein